MIVGFFVGLIYYSIVHVMVAGCFYEIWQTARRDAEEPPYAIIAAALRFRRALIYGPFALVPLIIESCKRIRDDLRKDLTP